jgi:tetratricopeptide (TPR) repeat protein
MKQSLIALALFLSFASVAAAQVGRRVSVAAGTPEDKAIAAIYAAPDGPDKVALLDKFVADFGGNNDMTLLGDQLYEQTYLAQKNYAKVYEYAEKVLALDPDDFSSAVNMVRAAEEQKDTTKLFAGGEKASAILVHFKAAPAPAEVSAEDWAHKKDEDLKNSQPEISYVEYALANAAFKTANPAPRAALLERYAAAFPDSPYAASVREQTAVAYQQAQNTSKMLDTAQAILVSDPNNVSMLLLLADYWSGAGKELDKAAVDAQKALDLLAEAKKPENLTDAQWQQQVSVQKGLAYSSLGQVLVTKTKNAPAVDAFQKASPLLKSDTVSYARNLYRLGFTLAKMQRTAEARTVLSEAVSLNTPWKAPAQETLDKIGGAVARRPAHKSS